MEQTKKNVSPQEAVVTKLVYKGLAGVRHTRAVKESVIEAQIDRLVKKYGCADAAELVASVDGYETLADMKADLQQAKALQYAAQEENALQDRLMAQAAQQMELALPMDDMYIRAERAFNEIERGYRKQKTTLEAYLEMVKKPLRTYKEELVEKECMAFRTEVLIHQVATAEQITVSQAEIDGEYQAIAEGRGCTAEDAKRGLTEQTVAHALTVRKVRALLVQYAEITTEVI